MERRLRTPTVLGTRDVAGAGAIVVIAIGVCIVVCYGRYHRINTMRSVGRNLSNQKSFYWRKSTNADGLTLKSTSSYDIEASMRPLILSLSPDRANLEDA
jgi:hypothetical protein